MKKKTIFFSLLYNYLLFKISLVDFVLVSSCSYSHTYTLQSPLLFVHCCLPRWINLDHTRTRTVLSLCLYVPYVCQLFVFVFFYSKILQDENREKEICLIN